MHRPMEPAVLRMKSGAVMFSTTNSLPDAYLRRHSMRRDDTSISNDKDP